MLLSNIRKLNELNAPLTRQHIFKHLQSPEQRELKGRLECHSSLTLNWLFFVE